MFSTTDNINITKDAMCEVESIWRITEEERRLHGNSFLECTPFNRSEKINGLTFEDKSSPLLRIYPRTPTVKNRYEVGCEAVRVRTNSGELCSQEFQGFTESVGRCKFAIFRKDDVGVLHENASHPAFFATQKVEMPVLLRGQSLISLNDETSVFPLKIPIKKTTVEVEVVVNNLYCELLEALLDDPECDDESYEDVEKKGNIILDVDGTLGDNISENFMENPSIYPFCYSKPIPRPGLRRFLRFVFAHYERVSIWTAALPSWYNEFKKEVLLPNMPPGAKFHFERTRVPGAVYIPLKPLSEIYKKYPEEYNESNTTVVDDNENTFKANVDNAVHIEAFFYDKFGTTPEQRKINAAKDRGLFDTIDILKSQSRT